MKRKLFMSFVGLVGFLLSPLSWWNDLLINIPLSYIGGTLAGLIYKPLFYPALIATYWLTNIVGFILMHISANDLVLKKTSFFTSKSIKRHILMSLVYTIVIVILIKLEVIRFPSEYFQ